MSIAETRQLGIEFERRVQTMIPEKEFLDKLDTDTIYSFLNQYQDKYIHDIYRNLDNIASGTKLSTHIESVLQSLLTVWQVKTSLNQTYSDNVIVDNNNVPIVDTARSYTFALPDNFYMYVRSVSEVSSTYSYKGFDSVEAPITVLPNQMVSQNDVWKLIETPHNSLRIMRYPAITLSAGNNITVIFDQYTNVTGLRVVYYKQPAHFDIMTSTACELPMDAFDDLVTGAVDLYVQYVAGAEARKRQLNENAKRQLQLLNKQNNNEE